MCRLQFSNLAVSSRKQYTDFLINARYGLLSPKQKPYVVSKLNINDVFHERESDSITIFR